MIYRFGIESAPAGVTVLIGGGTLGYSWPTVISAIYEEGEWHADAWDDRPEYEAIKPEWWSPIPAEEFTKEKK